MTKSKSNSDLIGDENMFRTLSRTRSTSQSWVKTTTAMEIPGVGCLVLVTTQYGHPGTHSMQYALEETSTFVPGVTITEDVNGGLKLVAA